MTGAIFWETRPAMIMRSLWRGEPRKTSAPKRAISNREALIDIISMAQQASPKVMGQMEFLRAQLTADSMAQQASPKVMGQMEFLRAQLTAASSVVRTIPSLAAAAALSTW